MSYKRPGSNANPLIRRSQYERTQQRTPSSYQTQDTLPLSSRRLDQSSSPALPSEPYITQPTQILNPAQKRKRTTSPDLDASQSSSVQVLASSPFRGRDDGSQARSGIQPTTMPRGSMNSFANSIAPPGTAFRAPMSQNLQTNTQNMFADDDTEAMVGESSEDEDMNKRKKTGDIPHTTFKQQTGIGSLLAQFTHEEPAQRRSNDAMANAYSTSRPPRPRLQVQKQPPKPQEYGMDQVDWDNRGKVQNLLALFPGWSVARCNEALLKCRGNEAEAKMLITDQQDKEMGIRPDVDLTVSEDELSAPTTQTSFKRPGSKPTVKVQAENKMSIKDKYMGKSAPESRAPESRAPESRDPIAISSSPVRPASPPRIRRRLVQGSRRQHSPTPLNLETPAPGPAPLPPPPRAAARTARTRLVESDDNDDEEEEEAEETDEEGDSRKDDEAIDLTDDTDTKVLDILNNRTLEEIIDLSTQPRDVVQAVLNHRPFENLDQIRAIVVESTSLTKTGKTRTTKKKIGDRFVDVCLGMNEGYEAVDKLVAHCEGLRKPIDTGMRAMGLDTASSQGELSFTDIDHDSGIGTPCSSLADDDLRVPISKRRLQQPSIMSKDLIMKDYQVTGLNWLALMWRLKLSCILADDMGLGKTCQVISFVSHLVEIGETGPHLIVVPGSTLENWIREIDRFSPSLERIPYYGSLKEREDLRSMITSRDDINVIVTTYDTASKPIDNQFLKHLQPVLCVFDEGHALKNSQTNRYRELMRIPAQMRLLLTGTPLQNNLQELISLLAFIMPKTFREQQEHLELIFKHKAKVTETDSSSSREALLSQQRILRARTMMTPFILRRKKAQVLKHIPTKTCRMEYCDMTTRQAAVYNGEITKVQDVIRERAAAKAAGQKPTWVVKGKLNNLIDLREAAIHPLLLRSKFTDGILGKMVKACRNLEEFNQLTKDKEKRILEMFNVMSDFQLHTFCQHNGLSRFDPVDEEAELFNSGKVNKLVELLQKYKANGDRTLVFSRFTMVLDILELVLNTHSLAFCRLDGSTQMSERQDLIDQFYKNADIPVFMLSTGAGGAGINLAAANKVIIFDMSFNPQDDVQAENRAHRVGQTREVEVIRLVTRKTIEEQIYRLGETKLALDERVAGGSGAISDVAPADGDKAEEAGLQKVMTMMMADMEKEEEEKKDIVMKSKQEEGQGEEEKSCSGDVDVDMKDAFATSLRNAGLDVKTE